PGSPLMGTPGEVLAEEGTAVITESMAQRLFGSPTPVGETITVASSRTATALPYTIGSVVADVEQPQHLTPQIWIHSPGFQEQSLLFKGVSFVSYAKLQEGQTTEYLSESIRQLYEQVDYHEAGVAISLEDWRAKKTSSWELVPLADIHFYGGGAWEFADMNDPVKVKAFLGIGIAILLLALFNFVNLQTALAARRSLEVGIRKTMGSSRSQLVVQFLAESVVMALFAAGIGLALAEGLALLMERYLHIRMWQSMWQQPFIILLTLGYALLVGLIAGWYPAIYLARFRPLSVMKSQARKTSRRWGVREALLTSQFVIASMLILGVLIIQSQIRHLHQVDVGFDREHTVVLKDIYDLSEEQRQTLVGELEQYSWVNSAVPLGYQPGDGSTGSTSLRTAELPEDQVFLTVEGEAGFLETLGFQWLAGRPFRASYDSAGIQEVVVNAAAARAFAKSPEEMVGTLLTNEYNQKLVVGVVDNFVIENYQDQAMPTYLAAPQYSFVIQHLVLSVAQVSPQEIQSVLAAEYAKFTDEPADVVYVEDNFAALLAKEEELLRAITLFGTIAIGLAMLGLFGLSAFYAGQETQEVGIRKILGASILQILSQLSKRYVGPIMLSLLVGTPLAYWLGQRWIEGYVYQTSISAWILLMAAGVCFVMAGAAISLNTWRAASTNPVDSLRSE
ncbi:MAG TPA: hypothetical protein DCR93_13565, partial [Cytophagales bacterium]|nr:hypothetical protein [Cytophagales bacterium]